MSKHLFLIVFFALFLSSNIWGSVKDNDQYNAFISVVAKEDIDKEIKKIEALSLIPIALGVKDNIDVEGLPNTAGSIALQNNQPKKSAHLVKRLQSGGYYIVGKTNLSEWANFRSTQSVSGWSSLAL